MLFQGKDVNDNENKPVLATGTWIWIVWRQLLQNRAGPR